MDINEEFSKKFKAVGVAEFFRKNLQMLGYSGSIRSFTTVIHELVTNGLDACEEYGFLPEIKVEIKDRGEKIKAKDMKQLERLQARLEKAENEGKTGTIVRLKRDIELLESKLGDSVGHYVVSVEDNGPGIPLEYVPRVFGSMLSGTKFHRYIQSRGQQGIGAVGVVLFSQMTTGQPSEVVTSTGDGKTSIVHLKVDVDRNKAIILDEEVIDKQFRGTKIVSEFKGLLYRRGEQSPYEYLRRTAIVNPHATIIFKEPNGKKVVWKRTAKDIPPLPKEMKPHPLGLSADDLQRMASKSAAKKLSNFLQADLSRISSKKASEILKLAKLDDMPPSELTHSDAERLISAFKRVKLLAPPTDGLTPIGEDYLEKSLEKMLEANFVRARTRRPSTYRGGIPFQIEVAIAYGGKAGRTTDEGRKAEIMRFANKTPLLFDSGSCAITKAVKSINWKNYHLGDLDSAPITVIVNLISPHVPYKSAGKQAVADEPEIVQEIRFAVMDAARALKKHLAGVHREAMRAKRRSIFLKYAPQVALALSTITGKKKEAIEATLVGIIERKVMQKEKQEEKQLEQEQSA